MVLASLAQCLYVEVVLEVEFVFNGAVCLLKFHESLQKVREKDVPVEVERPLVADGALPALVLCVDTDERSQVEALQVSTVLSSDSLPDRAHSDWAAGVQQHLVDLLHVCLILHEADVIVDCLLVTEEFLSSLQGKLRVLDPVLTSELEQLFRRDRLHQVDRHNVTRVIEET